jgi:hypothetical protein
MRYQQLASHAYCGAAGPVSKMASQQEKAFCVLRFLYVQMWLQCSESFIHGLKKAHHTRIKYFFKPCTKLTLLRNHIWTYQNGAHRKPSHAATPYWKLVPRPCSKHEERTAGSAWETWTVPVAESVCCARAGWGTNFFNSVRNRSILLCMPCTVAHTCERLLCLYTRLHSMALYLLSKRLDIYRPRAHDMQGPWQSQRQIWR